MKLHENLLSFVVRLYESKCIRLHSTFFIELTSYAPRLRYLSLHQCDFANFASDALNGLLELEALQLTRPTSCSHLKLEGLDRLEWLEIDAKYEDLPEFRHISKCLKVFKFSFSLYYSLREIRNQDEADDYLMSKLFELCHGLNFSQLETLDLYIQISSFFSAKFDLDWLSDELVSSLKHFRLKCSHFDSVSLGKRTFSSLRYFDLNCMFRLQSIEGSFSNFPNLQSLNLAFNDKLKFQPYMFVGLKNLRFLSLIENPIQELSSETFSDLNNLEILYMTFSNLNNSISKETFRHVPNLKILRLAFNQLTHLDPDCFACLPNLVELDLGHNQLVIDTKTFSHLNRLEKLDLSNNNIIRLEDGVFSHLISLKELSLRGNPFVDMTANWFIGLENLTKLVLACSPMTKIPDDLFLTLKKLESIELRHNDVIDDTTKQALEEIFPNIDFEFFD